MIPVKDDDIERIRIEFVEINAGSKPRLVDRFVGMGFSLPLSGGFCGFRMGCRRHGQDFTAEFPCRALNFFREACRR